MDRLSLGVACALLAIAAPSARASAGVQRFFFTPGPNGSSCEIDVAVPGLPTSTWCIVEPPKVPASKAIGVTLRENGDLGICRGGQCVGNAPERTPTLRYGRSISVGPFRCTSLRAGVRCVVTKLGRGFMLGAHSVKRV